MLANLFINYRIYRKQISDVIEVTIMYKISGCGGLRVPILIDYVYFKAVEMYENLNSK